MGRTPRFCPFPVDCVSSRFCGGVRSLGRRQRCQRNKKAAENTCIGCDLANTRGGQSVWLGSKNKGLGLTATTRSAQAQHDGLLRQLQLKLSTCTQPLNLELLLLLLLLLLLEVLPQHRLCCAPDGATLP
jgi:hypothetical protein